MKSIFLTSTFSQSNAERDAMFISYREALEKFAAESGDSLYDVALYLKRERAYADHAVWLSSPAKTSVWDENGYFIGLLLDHTIINNVIGPACDDFGNEMADPDTHGWWRKEFLFHLAVHYGMLTPPSLDAPSPTASNALHQSTTDDAGAKRIERSEHDLAIAKSQVEALKIQLGDAQRSIDELRRIVGDESGIAVHNTHLMKIALDVQRRYWKTADRSAGKQEVIIDYLINELRLSRPEAVAVERVSCPIDRKR